MAKVRVGSIVLRVADLQRQIEFWAAALDYVKREEQSNDFVLLQLKVDLYTDDQAGEVRRLIALGATEVHWSKRPADADYIILADPEGNRFCVVDVTR